MRRVVVTGMGGICALGKNKEEISQKVQENYCGIRPISSFDAGQLPATLAAEVEMELKEFFSVKELRRMDRVNAFGILAAREALADSDLTLKENTKTAVMVSSGIGGLQTILDEAVAGHQSQFQKISPFFIPKAIANMTAAHIAIDLNIHGYVGTPVTACAGSLNAILDGYRSIKDGYSDIVLAGGAEASINPLGIGGFAAMRALSTATDPHRASIPFDGERDGFVMGEGSALLILEEREHALSRGAKIYGEIYGGAITCDGFHITAPLEDGTWARKAVEEALESSGISAGEIDYINAHGTSTPLNDKIESKIYREIFGKHLDRMALSSTKSMTGHLLGASGALEMMLCFDAMEKHYLPPTVNYRVKDEECDVPIYSNTKEGNIEVFLKNALGFGGHNVAVVGGRMR